MASNNDQSILKGLDVKDHEAVRRFMTGLEYHLTHSVLNTAFVEECGLSDHQHALICNILAAIRNNGEKYPLLLEAALRFVSNRHRDAQSILSAAHDFENLAPEPVLTSPYLFREENEAAEARMVEIRGKIDIMRVRQRVVELAPGAFGNQIFHAARSLEIEKLAAGGSGDVRDIPRNVQFAPHPVTDGPQGLNSGPCHQCIRDNKPCDFKEPKCTSCRSAWQQCHYTTPARVVAKLSAADQAVAEPRGSSPLQNPNGRFTGNPLSNIPASPADPIYLGSKPGVPRPATSRPPPTALMVASLKAAIEAEDEDYTPAAPEFDFQIPPGHVNILLSSFRPSGPKIDGPIVFPKVPAPKVPAPVVDHKVPAPKPAASEPIAPKPAVLPPPSDRVTRGMARSQLQNTDDADNDIIHPFQAASDHEGGNMPSILHPGARKRKQIAYDSEEDNNNPAHARPSKRAKPAMQPPTSGVKRSLANVGVDDDMNVQPAKKTKTGLGAKISLSTGTKTNSEAGKRVVRGRPEQDREGKKCCNTCQAWKAISEFAAKKQSRVSGATVGYCLRCQANKQAKNKAKADAKKSGTQTSKSTATTTEADEDIEHGSGNDDLDVNKTLDAIVVNTEG